MKKSTNDTNACGGDEKLLARLEAELQAIESREILHGMTREDLEARGFVGEKDIAIERTRFKETTEKEKLVFEEDVEYRRLADHEEYESLDIGKLCMLADVRAGSLIATRDANETVPFTAGRNVVKTTAGDRELYRAAVKGKVVIIRDAMHVFPSDIDCMIRVSVSADRMRALVDCSPGFGGGRPLTYESVVKELENAGVLYGIREKNIREAIEEANAAHAPRNGIVAAEGRPALRGADAKVEYRFNTDEEKQTFRILPDGRIDYRGSANIPMARKGDLLAVVTSPGKGAAGMTVTGEAIAAESGAETSLVAGAGVRASEDGRSFYAAADGCIILNPPLIEVMDAVSYTHLTLPTIYSV